MKKKKVKPRNIDVIALIGKARVFKDKRRAKKSDVAGRKVKHKNKNAKA